MDKNTQFYVIYFQYKEQFEIDNRLFTDYLLVQKEAIRLGKLFDNSGEIVLSLTSPKRHLVFSSPTVCIYVLELTLYPKL
jgi:hypothetical protein